MNEAREENMSYESGCGSSSKWLWAGAGAAEAALHKCDGEQKD